MVNDIPQTGTGTREKKLVAFSSVLAAIFLTATKLTIGLLTGSLGILSEAAHSGLDLIAAGVTYFSVRISDRPPDESHAYGHGKIENLSALIETVLLFITCAWIVYEAVQRLFFKSVEIEVTLWSFGVMGVSIIIDLTRSRALMKTAKKYSSQALEADALHFSTDVWSSSVVILGLGTIVLSQRLASGYPALANWLLRADALAALGVAIIVLFVSYRLGRRTIGVLLDSAPKGAARQITEMVTKLHGVLGVQRIRVRQSGPVTFVDMTLEVPSSKSFEEADRIATRAETAIRNLIPHCDVIVHVEPVGDNRSLLGRVRSVAAKQGLSVHDVFSHEVNGKLKLEVHTEVPENLTVSKAHFRATALENALLKAFPEMADVVVHVDPVGDATMHRTTDISIISGAHEEIRRIAKKVEGIQSCHSISVFREQNRLVTSFRCTLAPDVPITQANELILQIEKLLREQLPSLDRITIHIEPCDQTCQVCDTACQFKRPAT